jgi:hypothetical protein
MRPGKYFEVLLHFRGVKEGTVACQRGQAALLAAGDELGDAGLVPDGLDPGAGQQHPALDSAEGSGNLAAGPAWVCGIFLHLKLWKLRKYAASKICGGLLRVCTTLCTTDSVLQPLYYRLCTTHSTLQTLQYRLQTTDSVGRAEGLLLAVSEASPISVGQFRRWNLTEMAKK